MRKCILFILVFQCPLYSSGQLTDSLQEVIFTNTKNYPIQKTLIEKNLKDYSNNNINQTISFKIKAIELAFKNKDSLFAGEFIQRREAPKFFQPKFDSKIKM